jgi:hypothetical protein
MRHSPGRPGVTSGALARRMATGLLAICSALVLPVTAQANGFAGQGGRSVGDFGVPPLLEPANLSAVGVLSSMPAQSDAEPSVVVIAASNIGNKLLRLLAPVQCTPETAQLSLTAQGVTLSGVSGLTNYKVGGVEFFLDGGLKETVLAGKPGHKRSETVYEPQYRATGLPSTFIFLPSKVGAQAGLNPVVVKIALTARLGKGRRRKTVHVIKTLSSNFNVCAA